MDQTRPPVRSLLSCIFCRQKKLRCDRLHPCSSCVKRRLHCAYANPAAPARRNNSAPSAKQLNQRIRQLEELVNVLGRGEIAQIKDNPTGPYYGSEGQQQQQQQSNGHDAITSSLGRIQVGDTGMSYVSGAHWAALQHSIAEIRDCIESESPFAQNPAVEPPTQGSALFLGLTPPGGKAEILEFIPSKPIVDRLVSRFFNSMEPGVLVIHAPTFQKEYDRFWLQPQDVNWTWLSIFFSIMCLAIHLHQRSEGEAPDPTGDTQEVCNNFRLQAAYCLINDKYTTPSKYTIEGLLLYTQTEYFRSADAQHEIWVLMGIIMRLAMRVGLHRDSERYQGISCFEAEMRRRTWALMSQLDSLFSFQMGLPRMIHKGLADTQLPRNLLDEDFDESSQTLPPPRPDTDSTPVSYLIAKGRIADVFGRITDHVASTEPGSYQSVLQLDKELNDAFAAAPAHLQFRSVGQSVTELPHIIMRRYNLEILYQKSRCVLHRRHLCEGRSDPRYTNSRRICIDAAMKLLRHQATIDAQIQPGGVLCQSRWFITSLTTHDFILAAMILCLELHYLSRNGDRAAEEGNYTKDEFLLALQTSHQIWNQYKEHSSVAMQAWRSISIMLDKLNVPGLSAATPSATDSHSSSRSREPSVGRISTGYTGFQFKTPVDTGDQPNQDDLVAGPPTDQLAYLSGPPMSFQNTMLLEMGTPLISTDLPEEIMMENIWDFSDNIDWPQWDAAVQNVI